MRKRFLLVFFLSIKIILVSSTLAFAQNKNPYQEPDRADRSIKIEHGDFAYKLYLNDNWIFYGDRSPKITMSIANFNYKKESFLIKCTVKSDSDVPVYTFKQELSVDSNDSSLVSFAFDSPLPGIYKVCLENDLEIIKEFNIAYEPAKIITSVDSLSQRNNYWENIKSELAKVDPNYKLSKVKKMQGEFRDVFLVEMTSLGKNKIYAYYFVPKKRENHLAIVRYGDEALDSCSIRADMSKNLIELVVLRDKNKLRGVKEATADAIRAIDFIESRKIVDSSNIFVSVNRNGGKVGLAACAIDDRIRAVSIYSPYFSSDQLDDSKYNYRALLAKIKVPNVFGFCLQETRSTPRNNYYIYNSLSNKFKQYYLYPLIEDQSKDQWREIELNFFNKYRVMQ